MINLPLYILLHILHKRAVFTANFRGGKYNSFRYKLRYENHGGDNQRQVEMLYYQLSGEWFETSERTASGVFGRHAESHQPATERTRISRNYFIILRSDTLRNHVVRKQGHPNFCTGALPPEPHPAIRRRWRIAIAG